MREPTPSEEIFGLSNTSGTYAPPLGLFDAVDHDAGICTVYPCWLFVYIFVPAVVYEVTVAVGVGAS